MRIILEFFEYFGFYINIIQWLVNKDFRILKIQHFFLKYLNEVQNLYEVFFNTNQFWEEYSIMY